MINLIPFRFIFALVALLFCGSAFAHVDGKNAGFFTGFWHPILGLDHLLAMVSVGILSAKLGRIGIWLVPAVFVAVMLLGGVLGMTGFELISVEVGIALSVVALGLLLAWGRGIPIVPAMIIVGIFALFHGHAHGTEMPNVSNPVLYALGFVAGTTLLHLIGVGIGLLATKFDANGLISRSMGVVIAACGMYFLFG